MSNDNSCPHCDLPLDYHCARIDFLEQELERLDTPEAAAAPHFVQLAKDVVRLAACTVQPEDDGGQGWEPCATNRLEHLGALARTALERL